MAGLSTASEKSQTALEEEALEKEEWKAQRLRRWQRRLRFLRRGFKLTIALVLLGILVWFFRDHIFVTVHAGEVVVFYYRLFGGTSHNEIGLEGLHIIAPWDEAYRYQVRTQTLMSPMTVLSKNGLAVRLDAQIRFHATPELVPYLHRRYGPEYIKTVITPQLTEAVQQVIGQYMPDELYSSENGASVSRIFETSKRVIGGGYLEVEDIALFNIKLPDAVQQSVQNKASSEQQALAAKFKVEEEEQVAQRRAIEAKSLENYAKTVTAVPRSVLIWKGIEATLELAKSPNTKVIVMGGRESLPLVLGNVPDLAGTDK